MITNKVDIIEPEIPPLRYKNNCNIDSLFVPNSCAVSVIYVIYDPKKNIIVNYGSSRPCGCNHSKFSIHAEDNALNYCRKNDKRNRFLIYIWRYSKIGHIRSKECCDSCTKLLCKYGYQDRIFTFEDGKIISAISKDPELSLGYKIKYDL